MQCAWGGGEVPFERAPTTCVRRSQIDNSWTPPTPYRYTTTKPNQALANSLTQSHNKHPSMRARTLYAVRHEPAPPMNTATAIGVGVGVGVPSSSPRSTTRGVPVVPVVVTGPAPDVSPALPATSPTNTGQTPPTSTRSLVENGGRNNPEAAAAAAAAAASTVVLRVVCRCASRACSVLACASNWSLP